MMSAEPDVPLPKKYEVESVPQGNGNRDVRGQAPSLSCYRLLQEGRRQMELLSETGCHWRECSSSYCQETKYQIKKEIGLQCQLSSSFHIAKRLY
ncbi:hypothetical protein CEXT_794031 [Caerostris extrusa]|uniref:Uncharacterized protein n=1 Tax=Caerostris extrusa TaxID=172846 RepID=A0AAV4MEU4_CAEEX|nr:hypothetical protein CEXT_794031 [Caerostris extrusa]